MMEPDSNVDIFLNLLKNNTPFCYVRFNDGEMGGIMQEGFVAARGDQKIDRSLQFHLKEALEDDSLENYYKGIPCSLCFPQMNFFAKQVTYGHKNITSAVALTNRNWKKWITDCPKYLKDKKILWIGGEDQDTSKLKDIDIHVTTTKLYPNKNTWQHVDKIRTECFELSKQHEITFISLGPTARVLCYMFYTWDDKNTKIDIGSVFDPYTRNVWHNCHKGWENGHNLVKPCKECN